MRPDQVGRPQFTPKTLSDTWTNGARRWPPASLTRMRHAGARRMGNIAGIWTVPCHFEMSKEISSSGTESRWRLTSASAPKKRFAAQIELAHVTRVATLGEMTASIAHEINQPLGAVVNNASACLRWLEAAEPGRGSERSAALMIAEGSSSRAKSSAEFAPWPKKLRRKRTGSTSTKPYVK